MKLKVILPLIILAKLTLGQSYLDKLSLPYGAHSKTDLLIEDSTFVAAISGIGQLQFGRFAVSDGMLIDTVSYSFDPNVPIASCGRCLHKVGSKYYYSYLVPTLNLQFYVQHLVLDQNLDTVRSARQYRQDDDLFVNWASIFDSDSTFIITGYVNRFDTILNKSKDDLWVAKLDTAFNVLWENRFRDNYPYLEGGYEGLELSLDAYGSVIVSGIGRNTISSFIKKYYGFAVRLGTEAGEAYWLKDFSGPEGSHRIDMIDNGDGTYFFAEPQIFYRVADKPSTDYTQLRVGQIDTAGNVLWDSLIGPIHRYFSTQELKKTLDGNFYVAGLVDYPSFHNSAAYKFSPAGKLLWYREYYHAQDSMDWSKIYTLEQLPDSSFLHVGNWTDLNNNLDTNGRIWFLRTDKHGCKTPGCHTVSIDEQSLPSSAFSVYPNPVEDDMLHIYNHLGGKASVRLLDINGSLVEEWSVSPGENKVRLSAKPPGGVYLLRIVGEGGVSEVRKLMVR